MKTTLMITVILIALLSLYSCTRKKYFTYGHSTIKGLEHSIEKSVNKKRPVGMSLVVVKNNKTVYSKGFGQATTEKKASPQTTYQWWSLTKPFTAVAVLQLQEKGLLDIEDPIMKYLPFFDVILKKEKYKNVTIKQLLSHSSGLEDIGMEILKWVHYENDSSYNQTALVKEKLPEHHQLKYNPGEKGRYTNLGYMVLAALIEKVAGKPYDVYIQDHILTPLEMHNSGFKYTNEIGIQAAEGTHPNDMMSLFAFMMIDKKRAVREKKKGTYWFNKLYANQQGSTGLIGSTEDLSHFMKAMLNEGVYKGTRILSAQHVALMFEQQAQVVKSPMPGLKNVHFGLSWFIHEEKGTKACSHGGAGAAFVAHLRLYPKKKVGIAMLANSTYVEKDMGGKLVSEVAQYFWD